MKVAMFFLSPPITTLYETKSQIEDDKVNTSS